MERFERNNVDQFEGSLSGSLLIAMPHLLEPEFLRSVVYICSHNEDCAIGLVVNRPIKNVAFDGLLNKVGVDVETNPRTIRLHYGGPVEESRGFVLHSTDYIKDDTLVVDDSVGLTATTDILESMANGYGPDKALLALGYVGWGPRQLESELQANGWLIAPADAAFVFDDRMGDKWERALLRVGIQSPVQLTPWMGTC